MKFIIITLISIFFISNISTVSATNKFDINFKKLEVKCMNGDSQSCADLRRLYATETKNYKNTFKYVTMAFDKNNPQGCGDLGGMYLYGIGVEKNIVQSMNNFNSI